MNTFSDYLMYLYWLVEFDNKQFIRFYRTTMPKVSRVKGLSNFAKLRNTLEICRLTSLMYHLGKNYIKGVGGFMDLPLVVTEYPEAKCISCSPTPSFSPKHLEEVILPNIPEGGLKGVIINETAIPWLNAHLIVEYSKVAYWVAYGLYDYAVVVFSVNTEEYPLGKIIDL